MSTTDTRVAFEKLAASHALDLKKEPDGTYAKRGAQIAWEFWQSATEAAKATGTAEELLPLPPCDVIAYSCVGENDAYSPRATIAYGRAIAEAALQPAPVVVMSQGEIHCITIQEARKIGGGLVDDVPADDLTALGRAIAERILAAANQSKG